MGRSVQRGFTLVELVITVAIVGLLLSLAATSVYRGRRRISLERANLEIRGLLEQARALSAVAGARVGTNRLVYGAGCTDERSVSGGDPAQWQLWVRFDQTTGLLQVPARLVDPGDDTIEVRCETFNLSVATNGLGQYSFPVASGDLAFAPSGRVLLRGLPGPYAYFQVFNPEDDHRFGVRVLPTGIICEASMPGGPAWCDETPR